MRKLIILITAYGLLFVLSAISFANTTVSFEVNGLKVILRQNIGSDVVAVGLYLRGGATYITIGQAGIENMALAVAQKATKNYPKDQLNAALESMNTRISHTVNKDYSSLNMQCVRQNFKSSWAIFHDILINPLFMANDTELERQRILSAIRQRTDDPDSYLDQLCSEAFFVNHPYMTDVRGTLETISSFSPEQLKNYLSSRIKTSHLLLVVAGNISQSELEPLVQETFGNIEIGKYNSNMLPDVWPSQPSVKVVYRDIPTNYIQGYFTAPTYGSKERIAMLMASRILDQRVFEEVRTKRSLSYAPAAGIGGNFSNFALLYVTAVDADSAIRVMSRELDRIKNEMVGDKLLRDQINQAITRYYRAIETNASQVNVLARYELSDSGYQLSEKFKDRLIKLTPRDIQNVCQKYIKNLQFVVLGNPDKLIVKNFLYSEAM